MARQLTTNQLVTRLSNAVAAGTTTVEATAVNMVGFESVEFEVHFGTITAGAVTTVKLQQSTDNVTFADLAGSEVTVADTDDNKIVRVEIVKPQEQYVRPVVVRSTQNAVIDTITARQYNARVEPVTHGATIVTPVIVYSPDEGTP